MGTAAARAKQKGPEDLRKQKRPGGPQRTKKGPQTLTGRIWDIRHISCLKKRCDLSVSAGTLSIAQFVRSYNPILEIYPNFFWRCADRGNFAAFSPGPAEPKEHRSTFCPAEGDEVRGSKGIGGRPGAKSAGGLLPGEGAKGKSGHSPRRQDRKPNVEERLLLFSGRRGGRSFAVDILSGVRGEVRGSKGIGRAKGEGLSGQRLRGRGLKVGKVIHIGGDFDGGRGNVIFRRRAKAGRCSKQRGNPHKLEEERGVFPVILETPKGPRKGFFRPREPGSGVVHRNPHEQVFLWITLWISG